MQDTSSKQQTKQKYKPNHQQTGLPPSLSLAHQKKNKKTNKEAKKQNKKLSTNLTKLTQTTGPISGGQKPKGRKNSNFFKEQTRNTEVQINEEEIGKLPEKEFRKMIIKMIKNLEKKWKKHKNQLTKT